MTTLASLFVSSPSIEPTAGNPYHFDLGFSRLPYRANLSTTSLLRTQHVPSRNFSPISFSSTKSAPAVRSNENRFPQRTLLRNTSQAHDAQIAQPQKSTKDLPVHGMNSPYRNDGSTEEHYRSRHFHPREVTGLKPTFSDELEDDDIVRQALTGLRGQVRQSDIKPQRKTPAMVDQPNTATLRVSGRQVPNHVEEMSSQSVNPEPTVESTFTENTAAGAGRDTEEDWVGRGMRLLNSESTESLTSYHHHRPSTGSSRLIQTVKTASFSNASVSLLQRSSRLGRSKGTHTHSSSAFPRPSAESERPPTASTLDEASKRRAFNRSQILQEIVTSEEGYLADIKALLQLYETLLASTTTMSLRMKSSVLRNISDVLQLHEDLIKELHRVTLMSASKRWSEPDSKPGLGRQHHHWRSLRVINRSRSERRHWRSRSSIDTGELPSPPVSPSHCRARRSR